MEPQEQQRRVRQIALVAHDNCKSDLLEWVEWNWTTLMNHQLICTGTTGRLVEETLIRKMELQPVFKHAMVKLKSGPMGGDQQLGALITDGRVDMIVFFWDPMLPQPHDVDVKALLRIAVLYNVPIACNRSTADFLISSPLIDREYRPIVKDYATYLNRVLDS